MLEDSYGLFLRNSIKYPEALTLSAIGHLFGRLITQITIYMEKVI